VHVDNSLVRDSETTLQNVAVRIKKRNKARLLSQSGLVFPHDVLFNFAVCVV